MEMAQGRAEMEPQPTMLEQAVRTRRRNMATSERITDISSMFSTASGVALAIFKARAVNCGFAYSSRSIVMAAFFAPRCYKDLVTTKWTSRSRLLC